MYMLVLGAGAIGSLLGARLSGANPDVHLYSTNREHMRAVAQNGLSIEELDGGISNISLLTFFEPDRLPPSPDLVLVLVKSYDTEKAVSSILGLCSPSTFFLALQNGIGNWERIAAIVGRERVLAGSTAQGATLVSPGRVRHGGNGPTYVGEPGRAPTDRVHRVVALLREAGHVAESSDNVDKLIWQKLIVNVGINAITGLTGIRNGIIAKVPDASLLCGSAVEEALIIARSKGYPLGFEMVQRVLDVARATARNRSSMGQDVDRRKRTEIDAINGAIVRFGKELGIPTPVNQTLTWLIKIVEATFASPNGPQARV